MHFNRLSLHGFKSFVDPTDFLFEPGMTGIVGPNGCGKSNLVEALRWAMGEISARKLRGEGMDDVIFGGTSNRPARNIAEVTLFLDNSRRTAPAAFNDSDSLEITRRIERGVGSHYRLNGREVRARDVQLLFADAATGARSTALVSQGQIETLIQAKPVNRRTILEEAAGITGLYSRRHEAELRLRAAEANLERLDDVIIALDAQLQGLKRQARQAVRYRALSDHIRKAEAVVLYLRWVETANALSEAEAALQQRLQLVAEATRLAADAATRQAEAAERLPALRQAEAEAAAGLQRLTLARKALDEEEDRISRALSAARTRLEENAADRERERLRLEDAEAAATRLGEEESSLAEAAGQEEALEARAREALETVRQECAGRENRMAALTEEAAAAEARRNALNTRKAALETRRTRLGERLREAQEAHDSLSQSSGNSDAVATLDARIETHLQTLDRLRREAASAEESRTEAERQELEARKTLREAETDAQRLQAEAEAIADLLKLPDAELWPPLIDALQVVPGIETALGAALGDDLTAPGDEAAPVHWRSLPPLEQAPALPGGIAPLSGFVTGPPALARRLSQIGLAEDAATAERLAPQLAPGQRLVTRDGRLYRWDGFTVVDGGAGTAAVRLAKRNRLQEIAEERAGAEARLATLRQQVDKALQARNDAGALARSLAEQARATDTLLEEDRRRREALIREAAEIDSRLRAAALAMTDLTADLAEAEREREEITEALGGLGDLEALRRRIETERSELAEHRTRLAERQRTHDLLTRDIAARRERLEEITREQASWLSRAETAKASAADLAARREAIAAEIDAMAERPQQIVAERLALGDRLAQAEAHRSEAADALAVAETALREADDTLRRADAALAGARENRVRAEGLLEQAQQSMATLVERVRERLEARPDDLLEMAGIDPLSPPDRDASERRLERLIRERETMGPVNLRAQQEAEELSEQIATMQSEREDLVGAIARLRRGIAELNREGRARFLEAFTQVNTHFQDLFTRLFGGGSAHLELTESDDPLEAGLEIMASPPGKRLQALSLLSGGEKALTTIALLFAVFMTNPAPICVLDEVDAPLDDTNVTRFCNLVEQLAREGHTRFILVTHHRTTMARMDRLFGVTMPERGVSRLVSVDLQGVSTLRAIA